MCVRARAQISLPLKECVACHSNIASISPMSGAPLVCTCLRPSSCPRCAAPLYSLSGETAPHVRKLWAKIPKPRMHTSPHAPYHSRPLQPAAWLPRPSCAPSQLACRDTLKVTAPPLQLSACRPKVATAARGRQREDSSARTVARGRQCKDGSARTAAHQRRQREDGSARGADG